MGWRDNLPSAAAFGSKHPRLAQLVDNVLEGAGKTDPALRQAAALSGPTSPEWAAYLRKLAFHAYRITDEEFVALKKAVGNEEVILEMSVAGALGAALVRLERGLSASHAGGSDAT
jgi:hypothetical protein